MTVSATVKLFTANVFADEFLEISKLSQQCRAGNQKSGRKLAKIAQTSEEWPVRKAEEEEICDQATLAEVAPTDKVKDVRLAAIERLEDQATLVQIAKTDRDDGVRYISASKLKDQAALADIASGKLQNGSSAAAGRKKPKSPDRSGLFGSE